MRGRETLLYCLTPAKDGSEGLASRPDRFIPRTQPPLPDSWLGTRDGTDTLETRKTFAPTTSPAHNIVTILSFPLIA